MAPAGYLKFTSQTSRKALTPNTMTTQEAIANVTVMQGPAPLPVGLTLIGQYNAPEGWPIRIVGNKDQHQLIHDRAVQIYGTGSYINCYLVWRNASTSVLAECLRNSAIG